MVTVRDMIYVMNLERRLGRELSVDELETDDEFEVEFPDGHIEFHIIPRLKFPDALLSAPEVAICEAQEYEQQ